MLKENYNSKLVSGGEMIPDQEALSQETLQIMDQLVISLEDLSERTMAIVYETDIRTLSRSEDLFVRYEASCKGLVDISVKILLRLYGETVSYDKLFQSVNEAISMIDDVDPSISIQVLQLVSRSLTEHKKYRST